MKLRVVSHDGLAEDFLADVPPNDHALYPAFWGTGESRSARLPFLGKNATPGTLCAALGVMRLCFGVLGWGLSTLCARYLLDQTWGLVALLGMVVFTLVALFAPTGEKE